MYFRNDYSVKKVELTVYPTGFKAVECKDDDLGDSGGQCKIWRPWTPFSLVSKSEIRPKSAETQWCIFKFTVYRQYEDEKTFYFATGGESASEQRECWLRVFASAINDVTMSLFPPYVISASPVRGVQSTGSRIMAGYLLTSTAIKSVSVTYCDLGSYAQGEAGLALYTDESCTHEINTLLLNERTTISTRKGLHCNMFAINWQFFCARTKEEKDVWLRALSNVLTKIVFEAPDPTEQDIEMFRNAVLERVGSLEEKPDEAVTTALLPLSSRAPTLRSLRGDIFCPVAPVDNSNEGLSSERDVEDVSLIQQMSMSNPPEPLLKEIPEPLGGNCSDHDAGPLASPTSRDYWRWHTASGFINV